MSPKFVYVGVYGASRCRSACGCGSGVRDFGAHVMIGSSLAVGEAAKGARTGNSERDARCCLVRVKIKRIESQILALSALNTEERERPSWA